jgi:3-oxoacyl-[acyl-carrier-protein] synthase-1
VKLLGYGETADAYHMTSPDPEGTGAAAAMKEALDSAGLSPTDIDYINMHGTGTKFNDSMEAKAVYSIFGADTPASTTKPLTGHTLGAAGALEAAICWKTIVENRNRSGGDVLLPVQVWDGVQDESMPVINIVTKGKPAGSAGRVKICMSNSFAFGGSNASLILGE